MDIPEKCTVLVIGGGPAGSYAASVLAREGIDTVLLEADLFPRYHVGESMLPSMRHFLRFIDLEEEFNSFGFVKKKGAVFKLNSKPEAYTDFLAAGGPNCHSWNVTRSDADNLLFTHASKSGARTFDGVKVTSIQFDAPTFSSSDLGKPVSASWTRKDGSTGCIAFEFLVDASGRAGLVSTKYMKNRRFNEGLKNIATWGYWEGAGVYGEGTRMEGDPVFEAIEDGTGWIWSIPLQDKTTSIGVVMNQAAYLSKKQDQSATTASLYHTHIQNAPTTSSLLSTAKLTTPLRTASDWSYTASSYSSPYIRIAGDAGCFIDPFFSSGVHLALASGLSAAVTICASIRGQCTESVAAQWHSEKVSTGYTRFMLVVMCSLKQIESREEPVLSDWDEGTFDRAFGHFRPVIQGTIPTAQTQSSSLTQAELANTVSFCLKAFQFSSNQDRGSLLQKLRDHKMSDSEATPTPTAEGNSGPKSPTDVDLTWLTPSEKNALDAIRARQMVRLEDMLQIRNFSADEISGLRAVLRRGEVGLVRCDENESDGEGDDGGDGVVERKRGKKMNNMLGALGLRDQMGRMEALF